MFNIFVGIVGKVEKLLLYADISLKAILYNDKWIETEQKNENPNLINFTITCYILIHSLDN